MNFKYDQPLVLKSGPQELKIVKMTTGTTTVQLSDGRMAWLTLSVDSDPGSGGKRRAGDRHQRESLLDLQRVQHVLVSGELKH